MKNAAEKLAALRAEIAKAGVDAYLVPRADEFLGEYVPDSAMRLGWLTGFDGSYGYALVLPDRAAVFTDPRYKSILPKKIDLKLFEPADAGLGALKAWCVERGIDGITIGFDPALYSVAEIKRLEQDFEETGITLKPVIGNLVDKIWTDRPAVPCSSVEPFLEVYAGRSATQKRELVSESLTKDGLAAAILSRPADVAWLLNIRGHDLPELPLALSFAILYDNGEVDWIIDPARVPPEIHKGLGNAVRLVHPDQTADMIAKMKARIGRDAVLMDDSTTTYRFAQLLDDRNVRIKFGKSPVTVPRAMKTMEEQTAIRDAHIKDAVALTKFLYWFDQNAPSGKLTEQDGVDMLHKIRARDPAFRSDSFGTIFGFGTNSAIPHYHPSADSNARIVGNGLVLFDSGAQYVNGTTDITRTLCVGEPTEDMCRDYTAVLRGHVAFAMAKFPKGTKGIQLDTIARSRIWMYGNDWTHAGHTVGCYLEVHEPGIYIGASPRAMDEALPGMLFSNEPATYWPDRYGIRLENLHLVVPMNFDRVTSNLFYQLETVSLVHFEPALTKLSMLMPDEKEWLAAYHARILDVVAPQLTPAERAWLEPICTYFM